MSFEIKCSTAAGESTSLVITIGFPAAAVTYVKWTVDPGVCADARHLDTVRGRQVWHRMSKHRGVGVQHVLNALCPPRHTYVHIQSCPKYTFEWLSWVPGIYLGSRDLPPPLLAGLVLFKFAGHLANALWSNCTICQPPFLAAWSATVSMLGNAPHLPTRGSQPNLKTDPETNKRILPWEKNKN